MLRGSQIEVSGAAGGFSLRQCFGFALFMFFKKKQECLGFKDSYRKGIPSSIFVERYLKNLVQRRLLSYLRVAKEAKDFAFALEKMAD